MDFKEYAKTAGFCSASHMYVPLHKEAFCSETNVEAQENLFASF